MFRRPLLKEKPAQCKTVGNGSVEQRQRIFHPHDKQLLSSDMESDIRPVFHSVPDLRHATEKLSPAFLLLYKQILRCTSFAQNDNAVIPGAAEASA